MNFFWFLNCLFLLCIVHNCVVSQDVENEKKTMAYLKHFGFVTNDSETMEDGIKRLQRYAGMFVTGQMDEETHRLMEMPRCGADEPEKVPPKSLKGAFQGSRWRNKNITYCILDYPDYLEKKEVYDVFFNAFNEWKKYLGHHFSQVLSKSQSLIDITFNYTPKPRDMDPNIILAVARFPIFGGDIEFSKLINWTTDPNDDNPSHTSLYHVALHEIGHSLGLLHSSYPQSIMSPYFMQDRDIHVHNNDKQKIRFLYKDHTPNNLQIKLDSTNYTQRGRGGPLLCNLTKLDAIIAFSLSKIYVFNEDKVWLLEAWTDYIVFTTEYPMNISERWKRLPSNIDAAYVHHNGEVYFFKGAQCWRYTEDDELMSNYPKSISEEFPGVPNDIDGAMTWMDNNTYFFKGSQYWKFDNQETALLPDFPKPISSWGNIPNDLNAVLYHREIDDTFFFKDSMYYKYDVTHSPYRAKYPRNTAFWWFNC